MAPSGCHGLVYLYNGYIESTNKEIQMTTSDFFTARAESLSSEMRVSMVLDLMESGCENATLMLATDDEVIAMHRKAFPIPFFGNVTAELAKLTILK